MHKNVKNEHIISFAFFNRSLTGLSDPPFLFSYEKKGPARSEYMHVSPSVRSVYPFLPDCLSFLCDLGDMRIYSVVPVEETFRIDSITYGKSLNSLVNVGSIVAKVRLNGE